MDYQTTNDIASNRVSLIRPWTCYKSHPLISRDDLWKKRASEKTMRKTRMEEEGGGRDLSGTFIRNEAPLFYALWWTRFCPPALFSLVSDKCA